MVTFSRVMSWLSTSVLSESKALFDGDERGFRSEFLHFTCKNYVDDSTNAWMFVELWASLNCQWE